VLISLAGSSYRMEKPSLTFTLECGEGLINNGAYVYMCIHVYISDMHLQLQFTTILSNDSIMTIKYGYMGGG